MSEERRDEQVGRPLLLSVLPGRYAVCRLAPDAAVPAWAFQDAISSVTRTDEALTVVCEHRRVPAGIRCEPGWACLKVRGPLDFSLTGILASLALPLARAGISLFALSTYDTDYVLVKADRLAEALAAVTKAGHRVEGEGEAPSQPRR